MQKKSESKYIETILSDLESKNYTEPDFTKYLYYILHAIIIIPIKFKTTPCNILFSFGSILSTILMITV